MPTGMRAVSVLGLAGVICFVCTSAMPAAAQAKSEDGVLPLPAVGSDSQEAAPEAESAAALQSKVLPESPASFVQEPARNVPVVYDVDVAVAGGGVSGVFAALGAARAGARTVLIERFGDVGGNIGPGMIVGGSLDYSGHEVGGKPAPPVEGGLGALPGEFLERYAALGGGLANQTTINYPRDANIASYVAMQMLREAGVELLLSSYVSDPIMEGSRVCGVFVENKSGRQAVKAKVVIDATGEADVARRAGAPVLWPKVEYFQLDGHSPTGMGLYGVVAGVNWDRYEAYQKNEDGDTEKDKLPKRSIDDIAIYRFGGFSPLPGKYGGLAQVRIGVSPDKSPNLDAGSGLHIARMEAAARMEIFEGVQYYKQRVPGFEEAYLLCIAPYLGVRGGPCIEGEYTLTMEDCRAARKFDDVIYVYGELRALRYIHEHRGQLEYTDMPYRVMVPRKIDGLLAVGRCASGIPDTLLRNRTGVQFMGQAGGTAAALAAKQDIKPRDVDIRQLQKMLLKAGFYLGDQTRLKELGLD